MGAGGNGCVTGTDSVRRKPCRGWAARALSCARIHCVEGLSGQKEQSGKPQSPVGRRTGIEPWGVLCRSAVEAPSCPPGVSSGKQSCVSRRLMGSEMEVLWAEASPRWGSPGRQRLSHLPAP